MSQELIAIHRRNLDLMLPEFSKVLMHGLPAERIARCVMNALQSNPKLVATVKPPVVVRPKPVAEKTIFEVNKPKDLSTLGYWLTGPRYNTFIEAVDSRGFKMFGLIWDKELGKNPSLHRLKRGVVVVTDDGLIKAAAFRVINGIFVDTEYGKQWKNRQRLRWQNERTT